MQYFGLNKPNSALINMICENFLQDLRYAYIYVQYCNTFIIYCVLRHQHYCIEEVCPIRVSQEVMTQ